MEKNTPRERMTTRERMAAVEDSLEARLRRVRQRLLPAIQVGVAAGIAYFIAHEWVGHPLPFFAPISVIIIVGLSGGERITRALDMSLGCVLGVLVGDLLFAPLGAGGWQIALAVGGSLLFASFFSKSPLVANQVAIGSILIATIMPPDAEVTGIDRTIDAFIGSAVGLAVVALVPSAPLSTARQEIAKVLKILSSVLDDVSTGISNHDLTEMTLALEAIRGTQSDIDAIRSATKSGRESTQLSPFLWGSRRYVTSLSRMVPPTDNAIRTSRVLARRALVLVEDQDTVSPKQLWILDQLSSIALDMSAIFEVNAKVSQAQGMPALTNRLRAVAAECGLDVLDVNAQPPRGPYSPFEGPAKDANNAAAAEAMNAGKAGAGSTSSAASGASSASDSTTSETSQASGASRAAQAQSDADTDTGKEQVPSQPALPALSASSILAQSRSLIVDMLQICGWSRESAVAVLKPTSKTPAYPPEVRKSFFTDGNGTSTGPNS